MAHLPENGFLRLPQIIGQTEVTPEQAAANRGNKQKPTRPRDEIAALVPVKKSCWWAGVKAGHFPRTVKLGPRVTAWRIDDIRELLEGGKNDRK